MSNVTIKQIQSVQEVKNALVKFNEVFKPHLDERISDFESYACKLVKNGYVYIAFKDSNTIGFVAFYANDKINYIGYLAQIAVIQDSMYRGVGYELLEQFEKTCKELGMKTLQLEVSNNNNHAITFYLRNNYVFLSKASESTSYMIKKTSDTQVS